MKFLTWIVYHTYNM